MLKKVVRSASAILACQVINAVGQIVLVPLFLSRWTSTAYGEWLALTAVVTSLSNMDLGMNSATRNALLAAWARGDVEEYKRIQGSSLAFYVPLAVVFTVLAILSTKLFPIASWMRISEMPPNAVRWIVVTLTARIMWQMSGAQIWNTYRNTGNMARTQWIYNVHALVVTGATAATLRLGGDALQVAIFGSLPLVLTVSVTWLALRRTHRKYLPSLRYARIDVVRSLIKPSLLFGVIMLAAAAGSDGPVVIVSRMLGGVAVALMVTTRTVANLIRQLVQTLLESVWPEMTRLEAVGATETLRRTHRLLIGVSACLCAAAAVVLWFEGPALMTFWTRGKLNPDPALLRTFLVCIYLQVAWVASSTVALSMSRHANLAGSYVASAVIILASTAFLAPRLGLIAVPLSVIAGEAVGCYHFVLRKSCAELGEAYGPFAARVWMGVVSVALCAFGFGWAGQEAVAGPAPARFVACGVMALTGAAGATFFVMLRKQERTLLTDFVSRQWKRLVTATPVLLPANTGEMEER
jgi:O-antigen/teichoic acid export membrane protein